MLSIRIRPACGNASCRVNSGLQLAEPVRQHPVGLAGGLLLGGLLAAPVAPPEAVAKSG